MNEDNKIIDDQFKNLPPVLQRVINSIPWNSTVKEIASLNKLSNEQVPLIERETMFVLYGFVSHDDFTRNLIQEAGLDIILAEKIANEVNEKIFSEIAKKIEENQPEPKIETKEEALERLKATRMEKGGKLNPSFPKTNSSSNLPMIEEGEVVHAVPHIEEVKAESAAPVAPTIIPQPLKASEIPPMVPAPTLQPQASEVSQPTSKPHYELGKDPYREPLV